VKIKDVMEQNNKQGMCTFDQSLISLFERGLITEEVAMNNSDKPSDMKIKIQQSKIKAEETQHSGGLQEMDTSRIKFRD